MKLLTLTALVFVSTSTASPLVQEPRGMSQICAAAHYVLITSLDAAPAGCSIVRNATPPTGATCQTKKALLHPLKASYLISNTKIEPSVAAPYKRCIQKCGVNAACESLAYNSDNRACRLYSGTLSSMGLAKGSQDTIQKDDRACFTVSCPTPSPSTSASPTPTPPTCTSTPVAPTSIMTNPTLLQSGWDPSAGDRSYAIDLSQLWNIDMGVIPDAYQMWVHNTGGTDFDSDNGLIWIQPMSGTL